MAGDGVHFSLFRGTDSHGRPAPGREVQELWFSLARRRWNSLVLVPADAGSSTADVATALADVGGRLRDLPVTAIVAEHLDFESARMLSDLQLLVKHIPAKGELVSVEARAVPPGSPPSVGTGNPSDPLVARPMPPAGQVIVSVQPVMIDPLGVAIAQAADAVALCIRMGVTRMNAARRTIELIGPERIIGAFVVR